LESNTDSADRHKSLHWEEVRKGIIGVWGAEVCAMADAALPNGRLNLAVTCRDAFPMHVTVSAALWNRSLGALVQRHPTLGIVTFPGGHIEPGERPIEAAGRELGEEAGVQILPSNWIHDRPIGLSMHQIPAAPGASDHWHCDLLFGASGDWHTEIPASPEGITGYWSGLDLSSPKFLCLLERTPFGRGFWYDVIDGSERGH